MKFLAKLILIIIANAAALWVAIKYIDGFGISGGAEEIISIAIVLTALNFFLKPILKLVLGPIIVLTLGLGLILVNAIVLYLLDLISKNLNIEGILALLYGTILISAVNFLVHSATKK